MEKSEVIRHLLEMADLVEIAEGSPFQINAFRRAGRSLQEWEGDLEQAVADGDVVAIEGVGKGIAKTISELVKDGRAKDHEELRAKFPPQLPELLTLSGIGPKKVRALWQELGVEGIDSLEAAARDGRVQTLKGFGKKTEEKILGVIERRRVGAPRPRSSASRGSQEATPRPAAEGRIRLGTSGYAHDEWRGTFYPEELKKTDYLPHYAARWSTVEINNSFYRFPSESALRGWTEQVPEEFLFTVKANRRISHTSRLKDVGDVVVSFTERCRALESRLGCILVQLPPDLQRDDARLARFLESLDPTVRYAVEFRHASWIEDTIFDQLRAHQVALVVHDDPKIDCPRLATADFVYVRLRSVTYEDGALADWRAWFETQAAAGRDVFAYLKHDKGGVSPAAILSKLRSPDR